MAVTKYESYYAKISENIKGIREYNERPFHVLCKLKKLT